MNKIQDLSPSKMDDIESMSDDEDENLTYEQQREKRMKKNEEMLDILGVNQAAKTLVTSIQKHTPVKTTKPKNTSLKPERRSLRIAHLAAPQDYQLPEESKLESNNPKTSKNNDSYGTDFKNQDSISIPEEDSDFVEKLNDDLAIKEAVNDFHKLPSHKFIHVLRSLDMYTPSVKVSEKRIYSLAIHPSETSLTVAAGDLRGNLTLYSNKNSEMREYRLHDAPVNCISFCTWDPYKLFSTSHDGSVRCGDIVKRTFDIIYKTEWKGQSKSKMNHATWHTEFERNLLIGNGSGHVDMIDTRTPDKIINTAWCHERSVRTVQCHPLEKHYFLTSSGIGEVSLWDIRNMTDQSINPVLQFEHPKSLTSAFFSASGSKMVSTCNDDNLRIFNTDRLNSSCTKPINIIPHNNHTGRWLSVFKAKWNPGRDNEFFVGSMLSPKRIQVYNSAGHVLHILQSTDMTTYCPVIEVHPTQAIYVGGNGSGRLHIFSTKEQLT
ncbi:PREDICTED: WD repeat-containing protein 76-like [Diuraphis noxia]|uniref:WD repeat-containing protein 76-like n=1 Tax=Diuraphis noxia TaxID=143948 RepID=UPI0007635D4E|nr:PREDICTED: WD repeat-containing protein 76-like [Diuraphis noxia]